MDNYNTNIAFISGKSTINDKGYSFEYAYETLGEKFYKMIISVKRKNDTEDLLPVIISEKLLEDTLSITESKYYRVSGQIRTYNKPNGSVEIFLFARDIELLEEETYENNITLMGFICKKGKYRVTQTDRKVIDFILAVNRQYGRADYLPVLAWGKDAKYVSTIDKNTMFKITGRFQSRTYIKKNSEGLQEERIAYEISSNQVILCKEDKE